MTPNEMTRAERLMIGLMCLPVILVGLLYLAA
jgi:hypothetical protein